MASEPMLTVIGIAVGAVGARPGCQYRRLREWGASSATALPHGKPLGSTLDAASIQATLSLGGLDRRDELPVCCATPRSIDARTIVRHTPHCIIERRYTE